MERTSRISLIGAGNIGGTIAHLALLKGLGQVILYDVVPGLAKGKALDLAQSAAVEGVEPQILGTENPADIRESDVVIVTAGLARRPGMTREDLLLKNAHIIQDVGQMIRTHAPHACVIVVTNPLDAMVWVMQQATGFPPRRVMGMAGVLDSARFQFFLAEALNVATQDIATLVLGGHGDLMVPLTRYTFIGGVPLEEWVRRGEISPERLQAIIDRTRQGGAEIVELLKTGSAFFTPAAAAVQMAESICHNQRRLMPVAAWLEGEYGMAGLYAGVPAILGAQGVERVIELDLLPPEQVQFLASAQAVRNLMEEVRPLLAGR